MKRDYLNPNCRDLGAPQDSSTTHCHLQRGGMPSLLEVGGLVSEGRAMFLRRPVGVRQQQNRE